MTARSKRELRRMGFTNKAIRLMETEWRHWFYRRARCRRGGAR